MFCIDYIVVLNSVYEGYSMSSNLGALSATDRELGGDSTPRLGGDSTPRLGGSEPPSRAGDGEQGGQLFFRITVQFLKVISIFISNPWREYSGADICRKAKLKSGTVYPMLIKMEVNGWLSSELEKIDPKKEGRPKKRLYKITHKGFTEGQKILAEYFPSVPSNVSLVGASQ